ncbi:MAG: radical SAM protein [Halodesulfurarchaeum sp.]
MSDPTVVLTADRSLMSDFRGNYILGFLSCTPSNYLPDFLYDRFFAPPIDADPDGRATSAPMGVRRIESGLLESERFSRPDVAVAHPHHLDSVVGEETEIVGVSVMDPRGMGPVTSSFTRGTDRVPMNAVKFRELLDRIAGLPADPTVVVGGGGAWQVADQENRSRFGIDHVVHGEAGHQAGAIFETIRTGDADAILTAESPHRVEAIPEIRGPTVNSLIEGMRGCGRGCDFCGPDMRRSLYPDPDRLVREARVNARGGYDYLWLHGEDILLYDMDPGFEPNRDAVRSMFSRLLSVDGIEKVGTTHMSLAGVRAAPGLIEDIASLNDLGPENWTGVQPGIETASPSLLDRHMGMKAEPFDVSEWPTIVEDAFEILNENYMYPAATLIVGLPGETEEDVRKTIELVERLDDTDSILAPLMFMDYDEENTLPISDLSPAQWDLFRRCWEHNLREIESKAWMATKGWGPIGRIVSQAVAWIGAEGIMRGLRNVEPESERKAV